ncbi:MAG TPA: DEAD/DEAH box helicase [bacterium]|nr:DEAD/DEAH box helicase [bacterium]
MTFNQFILDSRIHQGIKNSGYITPTPIQEKAIPLVLSGKDILGLAQTGTGKTAAFILPILQRLLQGPKKRVRALILAPTRELAEQIFQAGVDLGKHTGIRSLSIYGGVSKSPQLAALKRGVEIVVACPGRLLDHLREGNIDLSHVEVLVLDEADRMCDMGFLPDIRRILKALPFERQTLFFSATMPDEIRGLADQILRNPETVQIGMIAPAATVSHAVYPVSVDLKKPLLFAILKQTATGRVLIFTRTKHRARTLAAQLGKRDYNVSALQGNMTQNRRQEAINGFRSGKYDILVATDIAARGIDVSEVSHVINYDMTDTVDAYTHRIGRTGRALKNGDALTLAVREDEPLLRSIEKVLGAPIRRQRLAGFDYGSFIPESQSVRKPVFRGTGSRKPKHGSAPSSEPGTRTRIQHGHGKRRNHSGRSVVRQPN